jgi:predicted phage baseplate assembly protein
MTLPALRLDDLTWEDLRLLAQRRIPAASGGVWTHHAPVDPGVTLLELFAFLLEQQLFVLDQVPDSLVRAVLTLLGEVPHPTGVARTVLAATAKPANATVLPAGTIVRPDRLELAELLYTVDTDAAVLPVAQIAIEVDGRDITPAAASSPARLLPADGSAAAFDIVLALDAPAPADVGNLVLLIELEVPSRVAPAWSAKAASAPPPASLAFATVVGGAARALPAGSVTDGTLGLRRSGLMTFAWQADWNGASEIRLRVSTTAATFAAPPRVQRVTANAVIARHSVVRTIDGRTPTGDPIDAARAVIADQLDRWLPLSNLALDIPPILGSPIDGTAELSLTRPTGEVTEWENVADLAFAGPADRQFTLDRERRRLNFGDGYAGRVPAPATDFSLRFQAGGGPSGDLPPNLEWMIAEGAALPLEKLVNVVAAKDGGDAEAIADARARIAGSLSRSDRVVTEADIRDLIESMRGLGPHRAHVAAGFDPAFPCAYVPDSIGVFVIPRVPRRTESDRAEVPAPKADPGALALFAERLEAARMLATRSHVLTPAYRPVALAVTVRSAQSDSGETVDAIKLALARHLDAVIGSDGEGWAFGQPLRPSDLVRVAQNAGGNEIFVERIAIGIDGADPKDDCGDTRIGPHDLVYLAAISFSLLPLERGGQP